MTRQFKETHLDCPCGKHKDCFAKNNDGSGKCFSCGKWFWPKKHRDHRAECSVRPYSSRGVPGYVGERLNFVEYVDNDGIVQFYGWNYPNNILKSRRAEDKHDTVMDRDKGTPPPALGGIGLYDPGTSRNAVVVEGEPDAAAAWYMLNHKMANETPVYWLLGANISHKDRPVIFEELSKYDRVIMAIENDDAGKKAKEILATLLPESIRVASLVKFKDANEYLLNDGTKEFKRAVSNYSRYTPEYIFNGIDSLSAIWEEQEAEVYVPTEFSSLNELIKGLPLGYIVLIDGPEGLGKTEVLRSFSWSVINSVKDQYPVSVTYFEEKNKTTLRGYCCLDQKINFRDPDVEFSLSDASSTIEKLAENFYITDFYKARDAMSVASFMEKVNYLHFVCGVRYFFVDPINQLRPDDADENLVKFLDGIMMEMSRFCVDNNCCFVITAHTTDEGKTRDSRMIAKQAGIRISVHRDTENFDVSERMKTYFNVVKNRPFSTQGNGGFAVFNPELYTLEDGFTNEKLLGQNNDDRGVTVSGPKLPNNETIYDGRYKSGVQEDADSQVVRQSQRPF